jgi:hypothetical protein
MKMGKMKKQIKSEIKQLPFMLGKLTGGVMAVIGCTGGIIVAGKSNTSFSDIWPYFLMGIIGIGIFLISSKLYAKRLNENIHFTPTRKEKMQTSVISWTILLIFTAIFILITFIINFR